MRQECPSCWHAWHGAQALTHVKFRDSLSHVCRSEEKLKAARAALGQAAVHLIRINSIKGDPGAVLGHERIWRAPLPGCLPSGGAGEPPSRPPVPAAVGSLSASLAIRASDAAVRMTWQNLLSCGLHERDIRSPTHV